MRSWCGNLFADRAAGKAAQTGRVPVDELRVYYNSTNNRAARITQVRRRITKKRAAPTMACANAGEDEDPFGWGGGVDSVSQGRPVRAITPLGRASES